MKTAWLLLEAKSLEQDVTFDSCDEQLKKNVLWFCPQFRALITVMTADAVLKTHSKRSAYVQEETDPNSKRQCVTRAIHRWRRS